MLSRTGSLQLRRCGSSEIGIGGSREGKDWPAGEVLLASVAGSRSTHYLLAIPDAVLEGAVLTTFLDRVAPFGCPPPHSLIRAYSLPDSPFPSILLKEHDAAPESVGESYRRFLARARLLWLEALQGTGRGLSPALAWQTGPARQFLAPEEWAEVLSEAGVAFPGVADSYLGRGLLLLADPTLGLVADHDVPRRTHQGPQDHRAGVSGVGGPAGSPADLAGKHAADPSGAIPRHANLTSPPRSGSIATICDSSIALSRGDSLHEGLVLRDGTLSCP